MSSTGREKRVAKPVTLEFGEVQSGAFALPEPTLEIDHVDSQEFFQGLVDELTARGYRANTDRIAGQLESQTKHLEDMRSLVFKKLEPLP